jgi:hypothetical protein
VLGQPVSRRSGSEAESAVEALQPLVVSAEFVGRRARHDEAAGVGLGAHPGQHPCRVPLALVAVGDPQESQMKHRVVGVGHQV